LTSTLKEGGRAAWAGRARRRFHNVLAAVEVAIAVVLLAGAGLMLRSFQKLENVNPGFDPSGVLTMRVDLPMDPGAANENVQPDEVLKNDKTGPFFNELLQRLRTLPGVEYAGAVSELPLSGMNNDTWFTIEGRPPLKPSDRPNADQRRATPDYFKAMSIPLLKGRYFTDADNRTAAKVLIINQALADKFFPSQDPIGQHLVVDFGFPFHAEIIGVVGNVRHRSLASKPRQELYASYLQGIGSRMNIVVRTRSNPMSLAGAVKRQVEALNRDVPVFAIHTMDDLVSDSVGRPRFRAVLLGAFAALALLLAAAGIYGIMSYSVTQRTHELGVRVALGAGWWDVMSLVVGRGLLLALTGVAAGLAAALALARLIASMLYDVAPSDPASFVTVSLVLLAVAFLANYIPARRAAQVDPVVALRDE
jgi:putative ABC transport system permease protein